jgi:hypothetical protein
MPASASESFCGNTITKKQLTEIEWIVSIFPNLTRTELANTICELYSWKRPSGKLKTVECRQFLERLDGKGTIQLPACQTHYAKRTNFTINKTDSTNPRSRISVELRDLSPVLLSRVCTWAERQLWYEYVDRYHYLGYRLPFGAQLRYFIKSGISRDRLGCLQFSSPAWRMAARDRWIGWNDNQRKRNLQKVVNNSRFLLFPWVQVKNLASSVLALSVKKVPVDWCECYGYRPVLMETLVDQNKFQGTCYKAANWIHVGETTGRGRMDRHNKRQGKATKRIYLYPISKRFRQELMQP